MNRFRTLTASLYDHSKRHPKKSVVILILLAVFAVTAFSGGDIAEAPENDTSVPVVRVATVAALSQETDPLLLVGEVRSISQAELRAQKSGDVTRVYARAGQYVPAGAILAEIDSASERAAVLSAQGSVAAAEAQLAKVQAGDRTEDRASAAAQTTSALVSLQSAKDAARSAYSQSYGLAQDAVLAQADDFFTNTYTVDPTFRVRSATYDEKQVIETERVQIGELLNTWKERTTQPIPDDLLDARLAEAQRDLERIKTFLNQISTYVSEQKTDADLTESVKSAQEATLLGARSAIDSARGVVNGARTGLANATANAQITGLNESKSTVGARPEDIAAAQAVVTQARGGLASAYAALEKSIIRTPIAGTVSTLNVTRGDFVSAQSVVSVVVREGAQEVELYVSGATRDRIAVGMPALVAGTYRGTITSAAPGLDPITKKARVTVGLDAETALTNGSFVEVAILEQESTEAPTDVVAQQVSVPITAVKVLPRGFAVFTVSPEGTLVAHPIVEGPIVGSKMLVRDGLTPDMQIVIDVRGLKEGERVSTDVPDPASA